MGGNVEGGATLKLSARVRSRTRVFLGAATPLLFFSAPSFVNPVSGAPAQTLPTQTQNGSHATHWDDPREVLLATDANGPLILDVARNRVVAYLPSDVDSQNLAWSTDRNHAFAATCQDRSGACEILVIDMESGRVLDTLHPTDMNSVGVLAVGETPDRLWVESGSVDAPGIVELDSVEGTIRMFWKLRTPGASDMLMGRWDRRIYITLPESDEVVVINRLTVNSRNVSTGEEPTDIAMAPNGLLWVANKGDHSISVLNDSYTADELTRFPSGGSEPVHIAFNNAQPEAWVSHRKDRKIAVLSLGAGQVLTEILLSEAPREVVFSRDGTVAWVLSSETDQIFTVDVQSRVLIPSASAALPSQTRRH